MRHTVKFFSILFISISLLFIGGCTKDEEDDYSGLIVRTDGAASQSFSSVFISGENLNGGGDVWEAGFCWNTTGNPSRSDSKLVCKMSWEGHFSGVVTNLEAHTKYYARAYAIHGKKTHYGNLISFTTIYDIGTRVSESSVTSTSATATGTVIDAENVKEAGIIWAPYVYPIGTFTETRAVCEYHTDSAFSADLTGLKPNTDYYAMAYIITDEGTFYGNYDFFTTKD